MPLGQDSHGIVSESDLERNPETLTPKGLLYQVKKQEQLPGRLLQGQGCRSWCKMV